MIKLNAILLCLMAIAFSQTEHCAYRYNAPRNDLDVAYSLVYGADGNIYAAGQSVGSSTSSDFTVISLNPAIGIEEQNPQRIDKRFALLEGSFENQSLAYSLSLPEPANVSLSLYNLFGQKILSWQISASQSTSHYVKNLPSINPEVYFIRAEIASASPRNGKGKGYKENKKFVVIK